LLILAVDTSTTVGGVSLLRDGELMTEQIMNVRRTHSERLMSSVEAALSATGCSPQDLDCVAACIGPGSFTGVRIGVAAAKALAWAVGVPAIGVPGPDALAYGRTGDADDQIWALIDARHGRCYTAAFKPSRAGRAGERMTPYSLQRLDSILLEAGKSRGRCIFVGDGAAMHREAILSGLGDQAVIPPDALLVLRPAQVGLVAAELISSGEEGDPATMVPMYLRESEAEVKLLGGEL
jgi:tRNA threonylcarbamoyladenosine biosynthesis protein TsaB